MAAFQDIREQTEQKVMVHLLSEIERNPSFTQRGLAVELDIALGLMNQYLKRCVTKGWVRASQISPRRITYFLTPEGFKEKSHMVKDYLARSMTFFKEARAQCDEVFEQCKAQSWSKIALVGEGDLADIAKLVASGSEFVLDVVSTQADLKKYDTVIITDVMNPQGTYDAIKHKVEYPRLLTLNLLHISKVTP
ncbi:EPS-associated transcriptional regulator, MarR family [Holospora obtusa F1]|uniref:EPS-associated transcriptional regulator, MarR family n=1 Tax=Holospora obtusa F1 TaxID=1399147 RepID=W6TEG8_HOLOB|nr:winged helix-turn-helix transcriptional regulator [Holospora obtusa]ETZ07139.1 EPS-associated transcriptional regulator, MarR family [Holospora obtusa F1]